MIDFPSLKPQCPKFYTALSNGHVHGIKTYPAPDGPLFSLYVFIGNLLTRNH